MELPNNLKQLYRHWQYHTTKPILQNHIAVTQNLALLNDIKCFAIERMRVWERKTKNAPFPYSQDPILQKYRFCNIYRELDKQTIEYHMLLHHLQNRFDLWLLNMALCRFVCNPGTIKQIGLLSYDAKNNQRVFEKLKLLPSPRYGSAYIFPVSIILKSKFPSREEFFCFSLPAKMKKCAQVIVSFHRASVQEILRVLLPVFGHNFTFHWTEILIDTAYQYPEYVDLFEVFPIGPGSKPILKMLHSKANSEDTCLSLAQMNFTEFPYLTYNQKPVYLSAENWEGICCEFRKYQNLLRGNGRKRKYVQSPLLEKRLGFRI